MVEIEKTTYDEANRVYIFPASRTQEVDEIYGLTLFHGIWFGASIVFLFAFLLLSSKRQRNGYIFPILCVSFAMLISGSCTTLAWINRRRNSIFARTLQEAYLEYDFELNITSVAMEKFTCFVADLALIFKVHTFFPSPTYSTRQQLLRISPLVLIVPLRLALISLFTAALVRSRERLAIDSAIAEFSLQIIYCIYGSGVLLRESVAFYRRTSHQGNTPLQRRLRVLIESILFTFFIPLCFELASMIALAAPSGSPVSENYRYWSACNTYTTVFIALLSTNWSTIRARRRQEESFGNDEVGRRKNRQSSTLLASIFFDTTPRSDRTDLPISLQKELSKTDKDKREG